MILPLALPGLLRFRARFSGTRRATGSPAWAMMVLPAHAHARRELRELRPCLVDVRDRSHARNLRMPPARPVHWRIRLIPLSLPGLTRQSMPQPGARVARRTKVDGGAYIA
jgi:hypothetical protein